MDLLFVVAVAALATLALFASWLIVVTVAAGPLRRRRWQAHPLTPCRCPDAPCRVHPFAFDMERLLAPRGQALVEFAIIAPILMLLLLGVAGTGMYFLTAQEQAASTSTDAAWAAAHRDADADAFAAYADRVGPCDGATLEYSDGMAAVTLSCPSWAGQLLPGVLPANVTTTATAFVP